MDENEELYNYLFALRVSLLDEFENECDIIKELKYYLLDSDYNPDNIDNIINNFYKKYGIEVSLEIIKEVLPINENMDAYNNLMNILMNHNQNQPVEQNVDSNDSESIHDETNSSEDETNNSDDETNNSENETNNSEDEIAENNEGFNLNFPQLGVNGLPIISFSLNVEGHGTHGTQGLQVNNTTQLINTIHTLLGNLNLGNILGNMEDVAITVEDIDKLQSVKLEKDIDENCSICIGPLIKDEMATTLECKHIYHTDCIKPYLEKYNHKCPVCRAEIGKPKYNLNN
jgi:hypothetical protein